jgi:hypothetical protein
MRRLRAFVLFAYDFIVGDDWVLALGVVGALATTRALVRAQVNAWWLTPATVLALLAFSLWRAARAAHK